MACFIYCLIFLVLFYNSWRVECSSRQVVSIVEAWAAECCYYLLCCLLRLCHLMLHQCWVIWLLKQITDLHDWSACCHFRQGAISQTPFSTKILHTLCSCVHTKTACIQATMVSGQAIYLAIRLSRKGRSASVIFSSWQIKPMRLDADTHSWE